MCADVDSCKKECARSQLMGGGGMHPRRWQGSAWRARLALESGQTMAEYATLLGVLIIAIVVIFGAFSVGINNKLQDDLTTILSGM